MGNAPQTPSRLTIHFQVEGFPADVSFDVSAADLAPRLEAAIKAIVAAGGTAPAAAPAPRSEPVATSEPPTDIPANVRDAWVKVMPFGKNKGQRLGEQSDKELTYLAKEARMDDIRAAAKLLLIHRLGS